MKLVMSTVWRSRRQDDQSITRTVLMRTPMVPVLLLHDPKGKT